MTCVIKILMDICFHSLNATIFEVCSQLSSVLAINQLDERDQLYIIPHSLFVKHILSSMSNYCNIRYRLSHASKALCHNRFHRCVTTCHILLHICFQKIACNLAQECFTKLMILLLSYKHFDTNLVLDSPNKMQKLMLSSLQHK